MKNIFLAIGFFVLGCLGCKAVNFNNENLQYVITYKWGLIHKDAGEATLSLRGNGDKYDIMLAAKTKPWADKIYMVRDTLKGRITRDLIPLSYIKITHEQDKHDRDEIIYRKSGNVTKGKSTSVKTRKEGVKTKSRELTATGPVYDMLSVFYYLRALDYSKLNKNLAYKATVFSGSKAETITIKSLGKEKIKLRDKSEKEAYHIRFNFTSNNGKKSSDDMDTWISTDSAHIPLYLVGKLPVGEVRAYLTKR